LDTVNLWVFSRVLTKLFYVSPCFSALL
jgi:hypothetical protein